MNVRQELDEENRALWQSLSTVRLFDLSFDSLFTETLALLPTLRACICRKLGLCSRACRTRWTPQEIFPRYFQPNFKETWTRSDPKCLGLRRSKGSTTLFADPFPQVLEIARRRSEEDRVNGVMSMATELDLATKTVSGSLTISIKRLT